MHAGSRDAPPSPLFLAGTTHLAEVLPDHLGGPMQRQCGMTIGTFIIGACVLLPSARALSGERSQRPADDLPSVKAEIALAGRLLTVGTTVLAVDGTVVGIVSGLSRNPSGHVDRIRVTSSMPSEQVILIIRDKYFSVTDQAVQLRITIAELDAMPRAMTEDEAAGSPRDF
jgi:hypothetical protein